MEVVLELGHMCGQLLNNVTVFTTDGEIWCYLMVFQIDHIKITDVSVEA